MTSREVALTPGVELPGVRPPVVHKLVASPALRSGSERCGQTHRFSAVSTTTTTQVYKRCPGFCVTFFGDVVVARQRRTRCGSRRSWLRHERMTNAMLLAERTPHRPTGTEAGQERGVGARRSTRPSSGRTHPPGGRCAALLSRRRQAVEVPTPPPAFVPVPQTEHHVVEVPPIVPQLLVGFFAGADGYVWRQLLGPTGAYWWRVGSSHTQWAPPPGYTRRWLTSWSWTSL